MDNKIPLEKIKGCLYGGALGDALGYPVEFLDRDSIMQHYGPGGIRNLVVDKETGKAIVSDDTQMTLFSAVGLMYVDTRYCTYGALSEPYHYIQNVYGYWYRTQDPAADIDNSPGAWIFYDKRLHHRRAPGTTCMEALRHYIAHDHSYKNDSKGCGGIMRVAPFAIYNGFHGKLKDERFASIAGDCARTTHHNPMGYIPAAYLVLLLRKLVRYDANAVPSSFLQRLFKIRKKWFIIDSSREALTPLDSMYGKEFPDAVVAIKALVDKVISLANTADLPCADAISQLGEGWIAEETLAIALYCAMEYADSSIDSVERALIAAVNHSGDSDSTGSVCGQIMGALLGYEALPKKWISKLEMTDLLDEIADDLYSGCQLHEQYLDPNPPTPQDEAWIRKYIHCKPSHITKCNWDFMPQSVKSAGKYFSGRRPLCLRRNIEAPSWFDSIVFSALIKECQQGIVQAACSGLDADYWLPQFNSRSVSLKLDEVLNSVNAGRITIFCITGERCHVEHNIALGTLEMQSSGIRYKGSFMHKGMDVLSLDADVSWEKQSVDVPDTQSAGFEWSSEGGVVPVHSVPVPFWGSRVVLTFEVSGEFELYMFFVKEGETSLHLLFSKDFSCK